VATSCAPVVSAAAAIRSISLPHPVAVTLPDEAAPMMDISPCLVRDVQYVAVYLAAGRIPFSESIKKPNFKT